MQTLCYLRDEAHKIIPWKTEKRMNMFNCADSWNTESSDSDVEMFEETTEVVPRMIKPKTPKVELYSPCDFCMYYHFIYATPFHDPSRLWFLHDQFKCFRPIMTQNGDIDFKYVPDKKSNPYQLKCQQLFKSKVELSKQAALQAQMMKICKRTYIIPNRVVAPNFVRTRIRIIDVEDDFHEEYSQPFVKIPKKNTTISTRGEKFLQAMAKKRNLTRDFVRIQHKKKYNQLSKTFGYTMKGNSLQTIERDKRKKTLTKQRDYDRYGKCIQMY